MDVLVCTPAADDPRLGAWLDAIATLGHAAVVCTPAEAPAVTQVDGVVAVTCEAALLAAAQAERCGVPWHAHRAVADSRDRLQVLGRLTAAGIPTPKFAAIDAISGEGLDRLAGIAAPWRVTGLPNGDGASVADLDALEELAGRWVATGVERLCVEPALTGPSWRLAGLLDAGALRLVGIIDVDDERATAPTGLSRETQGHLAGLVAQACAALGLRQGPITAVAMAIDGRACLTDIAPCTLEASLAEVLGLVTPLLAPIDVAGLVVRHAVGESLDGFGVDGLPRTRRGHFSGT